VILTERQVWKILHGMLIAGLAGAALTLWMIWHAIEIALLSY